MADEDEIQLGEPEGDESVAGLPLRIREAPDRVLPRMLLRACVPRRIESAIKSNRPLALILTVPSESWVEPISDAVKQLSSRVWLAGPITSRRLLAADSTPNALAHGRCVVAVSTNPGEFHPVLVAVAEKLVIPAPGNVIVAKTMRACLVGSVPKSFSGIRLDALDFNDLVSCLPRGGTVKEAITRFSMVIASKSVTTHATIPSLEDAHGYGTARQWGLELARDVADLRAGVIGWNDVDRGILITGPSGTGKTIFARMLAANCGIPIVTTSIGEMFATTSGHVDSINRAMTEAFNRAAAQAPSILFLDEIDGIPNRSQLSRRNKDYWLPVVNYFLTLLDSAVSNRAGVIVVGATNADPAEIDPAILRPGRLERFIHIGPPDARSLEGILRFYLGDALPDVSIAHIADAGADIEATGAVAMEWTRAARRLARRAGRAMTLADLEAQVILPDDRTASELERTAVHEAGHATLAVELGVDWLERVSIIRASEASGFTKLRSLLPLSPTRADIDLRVLVFLAGRAAEIEFLGSPSAGAAADLAAATRLVIDMHTGWGLGETLVSTRDENGRVYLGPDLRTSIEDDMQILQGRARSLVAERKEKVLRLAAHLIQKRTLSGEEVRMLLGADTA